MQDVASFPWQAYPVFSVLRFPNTLMPKGSENAEQKKRGSLGTRLCNMYTAIIHLLQISTLSHTCQVGHRLVLNFSEHDCTVKVQIRTPAAVSDRWRSECVHYRVWCSEFWMGWGRSFALSWAADFFQVEGGLSWICIEVGWDRHSRVERSTQSCTHRSYPPLRVARNHSALSLASYPGLLTPAFASTSTASDKCWGGNTWEWGCMHLVPRTGHFWQEHCLPSSNLNTIQTGGGRDLRRLSVA